VGYGAGRGTESKYAIEELAMVAMVVMVVTICNEKAATCLGEGVMARGQAEGGQSIAFTSKQGDGVNGRKG